MNKKFSLARAAKTILLGFALTAGTTSIVHAQGEIPSGTLTSSGASPFDYNLTISNGAGATASIGSVWYSWIPGQFYLPGTPTLASAPSGWSATIFGNSVEYIANSSASYIDPGESLSGFSYRASFSPAQLAAAPNSAVSYVYSAAAFSDAGVQFNVQTVPEPSGVMLLSMGASTLWLMRRRNLLRA